MSMIDTYKDHFAIVCTKCGSKNVEYSDGKYKCKDCGESIISSNTVEVFTGLRVETSIAVNNSGSEYRSGSIVS